MPNTEIYVHNVASFVINNLHQKLHNLLSSKYNYSFWLWLASLHYFTSCINALPASKLARRATGSQTLKINLKFDKSPVDINPQLWT